MMSGGISGKVTDRAIKAFVAKAERGKKLADGGGLHLFITPAGGTTWRVKYRLGGKEKIYSIGPTNTQNPNPYRLGFFCPKRQCWRGFRAWPRERHPCEGGVFAPKVLLRV